MEKKYKMEKAGDNLFRVVALKDFGNVKKGDIGGFIEKEENLSQEGLCWVYDNALICEGARVSDNARVLNQAFVQGYSIVAEMAEVSGGAEVLGNACIEGHGLIFGHAKISGNCCIKERAVVGGNAVVKDRARIKGNARVFGDAKVYYDQQVLYGTLDKDVFATKDWKQAIYNLYGILPVNNKVILYKKVNENFTSMFDKSFKYPKKGVIEVKEYNKDITMGCASGLHFAGPDYWDEGNTLLAAEIDLEDIITIQSGKVRVKKANILGVVAKTDENGDLILSYDYKKLF